MQLTDEHIDIFRATLSQDDEGESPDAEQVEALGGSNAYSVLVAAVLYEAVDRRFKEVTVADIIRYVADFRARWPKIRDHIDPLVAERVLRAYLGDGDVSDMDGFVLGGAQTVLAWVLVTDAKFTNSELDEFLAVSRATAERWIAESEDGGVEGAS